MAQIDHTHDPRLRSWVESANGHPDFPVQNLPLGVFSPAGGAPRGGVVIAQSPAILEYLEEAYPAPALLPGDPVERARVRAVAALIGCDIHPLHNIGPLRYLRTELGRPEPEVGGWIAHWIGQGLSAVEAMIGDEAFCFGSEPGMADVYLVPQLYAARRFDVPLDGFSRILRVERVAAEHPAFREAHPANQPDAEAPAA